MNHPYRFVLVTLIAGFAVVGCALLNPQTASADDSLLSRVQSGQSTTIVTLGTSLTDGDPWVTSLETWLNEQSPDPGSVTIFNRAVSSASSDNTNPALSGLVTQMPLALAHNPDAVLIEFSINDAKDSYGITVPQANANLLNMIGQFQTQNPDVIIILQTMNNTTAVNRASVPDYYQGYRDIAAQEGLLLIDHYPTWLELSISDPTTWDNYVPDGLHPNADGQAAILLPGIQAALQAQLVSTPTPAALPAGLMLMCGFAARRRTRRKN